jgi:GPH family glycoside/pentoside/hexuronide:cation symporter
MATESEAAPANSVPLGLRISFGIGSLSQATVLNSTAVLLLFFMTNVLGIRPAVAGLLLFVSKIVDVLSSPVIGMLSDRTNTRIGRRRPYLLGGGTLMCITFILLFSVPTFSSENLTAGYLAVLLILLSLSYGTFTIPYLAIAAETTRTYDERTSIMAYRVLFILVGTFVGTVIGPAIATPPGGVGTRESFSMMAVVLGSVILISAVLCFWGTRRATFFEPDDESPSLSEQMRIAANNKPFVTLACAKLLQLIGVASVITCALYLTRYVLNIEGQQVAVFFLTMTASSALSVPLWWWLARKVGKKTAYITAVLLYALTALTWLGVGPMVSTADAVAVYGRALILGVAGSGLILLGVSMLPDTIAYDHLTSGARREGIFTGLWSAVEKGASAMGGLLIGIVLDVTGFVKSTGALVEQSESAINGIVIGSAVLPALFMLASVPLLFKYSLSQERLEELEQQR